MADPVKPTPSSWAIRWLRTETTPDRLRLMAIVTTLVVISAGLVAWLLTDRLVSETDEVAASTGEVLIASQQVNASMAEADTAAVSVHLAGADGDREQRRLYEQALDRATIGLERVARLVGEDQVSHDLLAELGSLTTEYVGLIESARLASVEGIAGADQRLRQANAINRDDIAPRVQRLTQRAQSRFDDDTDSNWYIVSFGVLLVVLGVLLLAQVWMRARFRRWISVPLLLATIVTLVLLIFSARAFAGRQQSFTTAEDEAYDALVVSAEIQQTAYRYRAIETESVLQDVAAGDELAELGSRLANGTSSDLLRDAERRADSAREEAGAREVAVRWERYVAESARVQNALGSGDRARAESLTRGSANSAFNGFNTSVEAALLDNREQFLQQLDEASDSLSWLRSIIGIGTGVAAVLAWWGFAVRIGEYR